MRPIHCGNCEWEGDLDEHDYVALGHVENLETRLESGQEVPAGECGNCGALVYLGRRPKKSDPTMTVNKAFKVLVRRGYHTVDEEKEVNEAVKMLAEIFDGAEKRFFCPECGGSHFGTSGCQGPESGMVGHCDSCRRSKGFEWPRTDDDKYFRWVITLPANMIEDTPKEVWSAEEVKPCSEKECTSGPTTTPDPTK